MTALADMLSDRDRERLERARELAALDRLMRQVPAQRPAPVPPPLFRVAASGASGDRTT